MSEPALQIETAGPVTRLWLNRPAVHNAFDAALIEGLTQAFLAIERQTDVRVIVLAARGRSFSAGADIEWMKQQGTLSLEQNTADARRLAEMFRAIAQSSKPILARVHGAVVGGGIGLVSACDVAIGSTNATFATSEVRLGLIPATIAPYVVRAVGERQARRLFLTGERMDAFKAERIGLLHEAVPLEQLDERIEATIQMLLAGGPLAQSATKNLVDAVAQQPITATLIEDTAGRIARCRAGSEAGEGLSAFLEKRRAAWVPAPDDNDV